jgi:hypothetical protein
MKFGVIMSLGSTYRPVVVEVDDKLLDKKRPIERLKIIKTATNQAVIDNVVIVVGPALRGTDEDFYESDFVVNNASFGDATWAADDVRKALTERGYSDCKKNVIYVVENCNKINDSMIEAGWTHIECVIDDNAKNLVKAKKK